LNFVFLSFFQLFWFGSSSTGEGPLSDPFPFDSGYKYRQLTPEGQKLVRCMACLDAIKTIVESLENKQALFKKKKKEVAVVEAMNEVLDRFGKFYGLTKGLPFKLDGTESLHVSTSDYNDHIVKIMEENEEQIENIFYSEDPFPKRTICIEVAKGTFF